MSRRATRREERYATHSAPRVCRRDARSARKMRPRAKRKSPVRAVRLQPGVSVALPPVIKARVSVYRASLARPAMLCGKLATSNWSEHRERNCGAAAQFIIHHSSFIIGVSALLLCASLHPESNPTSLPQPPHHTAFAPQPKLTSSQNPMGLVLKPNGFDFETQWVWF